MNRKARMEAVDDDFLNDTYTWDKEEVEYLLTTERSLGLVKHIIKLLTIDEIMKFFPEKAQYVIKFKYDIARCGGNNFHLRKIKSIFLTNINAILRTINNTELN